MSTSDVTPGTPAAPGPTGTTPLQDSARRLARTVDALDDAAYAAASLLPGWTRAHVVAHLTLNAEALALAVRGATAGTPVAMYRGDDARDGDIEALATAPPTELRARLHAATTDLDHALAAVPEHRLDVTVERTPGSDRTFRVGDVASMRRHEVEFHHADLGAGYGAGDWPDDFALLVVDRLAPSAPATLVVTDAPGVGGTWQADPDTPTVTGTAADLGWWLSGRGDGGRLTSDGVLPRIEAW